MEDELQNSLAILRTNCLDESIGEEVRSACAQTIGICVYFSCEQIHILLDSLKTLKTVWSSVKLNVVGSAALFSSSIFAWVLLMERVKFRIVFLDNYCLTNFL